MSWPAIKSSYAALAKARDDDDGDPDAPWDAFATLAREAPVPYHLQSILAQIEEIRRERPPGDVRILDHGCGGALTVLYLAARGYTGVYGVDVGGTCERWNTLATSKFAARDQRFFVYDGDSLPFSDGFFDFVFSQEVVEHIRPNVLDSYYADEARVMKPGATAFHRVPHRLVPFDSHTNTWFIHYLPRGFWLAALRRMGRDLTTAEAAIFLRWPWVHRRLARKYLGNCEDRTMIRFRGVSDLSHYEGPKGLRRLVGGLLKVPGVGWLAGKVLTNFVMLDTVSRKHI